MMAGLYAITNAAIKVYTNLICSSPLTNIEATQKLTNMAIHLVIYSIQPALDLEERD